MILIVNIQVDNICRILENLFENLQILNLILNFKLLDSCEDLDGSCKILKNDPTLGIGGVDTAETELSKILFEDA